MKKLVLALTLLTLILSVAAYASQTVSGRHVHSVKFKEGDFPIIRTTGTLPDEGCGSTDRGIIDDSTDDGKSMVETARLALLYGKRIDLAVDGCLETSVSSGNIAPKIIMVRLHQF